MGTTPAGLAIATGLAVTLAAIAGSLYGFVEAHNPLVGYVTFALTAGFAYAVGRGASGACRAGKVRDPIVSRGVALGAASVALSFAWVAWTACQLRGDVAGNFAKLLFDPRALGFFVGYAHEHGTWTVAGGVQPRGVELTVIWGAEALLVLGLPQLWATRHLDAAFCESCRRWCIREEGLARLDASSPGAVASAIADRDWAALVAIGPPLSSVYVRVDVDLCPGCDETQFLSAVHVIAIAEGQRVQRTELRYVPRTPVAGDELHALRVTLAEGVRENLRGARTAQPAPPPPEEPAAPPRDPVRDARLAQIGKNLRARKLERERAEEAAIAEIVPNDEGYVHGPTRAEVILAALRASALGPFTFAGLAILVSFYEGLTGSRVLSRATGREILSLLGTSVVVTFLVMLVTKLQKRPLRVTRARVFEKGQREPYLLILLLATYASLAALAIKS